MSVLATRVKRLYDAEYPAYMQLALRIYLQHMCDTWIANLSGQELKSPTRDVVKANNILAEWWPDHDYSEDQQKEDWNKPATVAVVGTWLERMVQAELPHADRALALLKRWTRQQLVEGRDPDVELTKLRDKARAYYAAVDTHGEGVIANG